MTSTVLVLWFSWVVMLCCLVDKCFGRMYFFHHQGQRWWRQYIPPECWYLYTELHGITFQNNAVHFCGCPTHLACI